MNMRRLSESMCVECEMEKEIVAIRCAKKTVWPVLSVDH